MTAEFETSRRPRRSTRRPERSRICGLRSPGFAKSSRHWASDRDGQGAGLQPDARRDRQDPAGGDTADRRDRQAHGRQPRHGIARREIARVYDESLRPGRLDLERSTREVLDAVNVVNGAVAKVRTGRGQRAWILRSSAIGLVVGLVALPAAAPSGRRLLPAHWNIPERMATSALGRQGWDAGALLMQADSPPDGSGLRKPTPWCELVGRN